MRVTLLLLAACNIDSELNPNEKDPDPFDTSDSFDPGLDTEETAVVPEDCNGVDDDGDGEVDEGFDDLDANGRADCVDVECPALELGTPGTVEISEECSGTSSVTVTDPWNATIEYQYTSAGSGVIVMPAVGNLNDDNGDGNVDENDIPDIAFSTWSSNTLVALDGATGAELFELSGYDGQGGPSIADVDADGDPEIVAFQTGYKIAAVDASGAVKWVSSSGSMQMYPQMAVADLDNDGMPEVVGDTLVVNGEDGSTVANLTGVTNSWRTPVCADLDQDGFQEIILGNQVFDHNGTKAWSNPGNGSGNFAAVADIDGDPEGEVVFVSGSTAYIHDSDGSLITSFTIPGSNPGPPAVADFDGDGEVEVAVPANTKLSVFEFDGTINWQMPIQDNSGLAGCSGYDVDGDGAYEVTYADEIAFRIYSGIDGTVHYENTNHGSGTVWEYPVIADVDNDGSAEIVVADNGGKWKGVTVYGHNGSGWPKSGTTWGTHDFAVTNLNSDGSVPSPPEPSWQVYNVFRARPAVDDPSSPDLRVAITDQCVADCEYGPVAVGVQVSNHGGQDVSAGRSLRLYADDDTGQRLVAEYSLPEIPAGTVLDGIEFELTIADVGQYGWIARVDEADFLNECDESNNEDRWTDAVCP